MNYYVRSEISHGFLKLNEVLLTTAKKHTGFVAYDDELDLKIYS